MSRGSYCFPSFKEFFVIVHEGGHKFECSVVASNVPTSDLDLEKMARGVHLETIRKWVSSKGKRMLGPRVRYIGPLPLYIPGYGNPSLSVESASPQSEDATTALETDKPEGTRDVEKFLKEQQDKLWRGD